MATVKELPKEGTFVSINKADNQILLFLNRGLIYTNYWDGDVERHETVTITPFLRPGDNILIIAGLNWGGTYDFEVTVTQDGNVIKPLADSVLEQYGAVWSQAFPIRSK